MSNNFSLPPLPLPLPSSRPTLARSSATLYANRPSNIDIYMKQIGKESRKTMNPKRRALELIGEIANRNTQQALLSRLDDILLNPISGGKRQKTIRRTKKRNTRKRN